MVERERERGEGGATDRQTDRQREGRGEADRQKGRHAERQTDRRRRTKVVGHFTNL